VALLHEAPGGFRPHDPFTQLFGATHWLLCVQTSKQRVPLQANG
jgi:hypothetical protein